MSPRACKRLAEVDFPIAVVSKNVSEKASPKGYPSMLHLWWARRPLGSSRAMLLALLLPDPCDDNCPSEFKLKARDLLERVQGRPGPKDDDLRNSLLKFIGDFVSWDLASNRAFLEVGRGLVTAAYPENPPLVADPFAGGGSIPLEALRLGCEAFASDLNPVACMILKVMLEDIPRQGPGLGAEVRRVGKKIQAAAEHELSAFYPPDPDGAQPVAYLWARTIRCETSGCGAEIPLARGFWLSKKWGHTRALRYSVLRRAGTTPSIQFELFEPQSESELQRGTVSRAKATCPACAEVLAPARVRAQLREQHGGADVIFDQTGARLGGARLLAVVTRTRGAREQGQRYRLPEQRDYDAVLRASRRLDEVAATSLSNGLSAVPEEKTPEGGGRGAGRAFSVQKYGMLTFGELFTARQKLAVATLRALLDNPSLPNEVRVALALAVSRVAMSAMSCTRWNASAAKMQHTFGRPALPIVWDFAEVVVTSRAPGNWTSGFELVADVIEACPPLPVGQVHLADARACPLPSDSADVWFTDPPYYDAVPYADLSDFFFVWLKRSLPNHPLLRDPFDPKNPLTPKLQEIVQDDSKPRTAASKTERSLSEQWARRLPKVDACWPRMELPRWYLHTRRRKVGRHSFRG